MTGEHRGEEQEEGRSGQEGRQDSPELVERQQEEEVITGAKTPPVVVRLEPLEMKGDAPG
jgi:hypothetical protein